MWMKKWIKKYLRDVTVLLVKGGHAGDHQRNRSHGGSENFQGDLDMVEEKKAIDERRKGSNRSAAFRACQWLAEFLRKK